MNSFIVCSGISEMIQSSGMVRGVVYFRFKHQPALDRVDFDASEIAVGDLKTKIAEKTLCNRQDIRLCELQADGVTVKSPLLFDGELIHSGASLLVIRAPLSTKAGNIKVAEAGYFVNPESAEDSNEEQDVRKLLVPETAICPLCNSLMTAEDHEPRLLTCCGQTACVTCLAKFSSPDSCAFGTCPKPGTQLRSQMISKQVELIISRKDNYEWRGFLFPGEIFAPPVAEVKQAEVEEAIDIDAWEAAEHAVVDLDDDTAPVVKRKKARVVNLVKDEIKAQLKAEYTQEDIKRLFRQQEKQETISPLDIPGILTVDFPRVLTASEFERWRNFSS